jgi:thiosulfate/3-mercaptopyruvate sulfurtransferase
MLPTPHPRPILVHAAEAARLVDAGAVILDSRGRLDFLSGHLPGAQRVDWRIGVTGSLRTGALGPPALAAHDFAALGVDAARPVLVVGAWAHGWGEEGRIAWDLLYLGHSDVYVLRGGVEAWPGSLDHLPRAATPGVFEPSVRPELRVDRAHLGEGGTLLLDVREPDEFAGARLYGEARGGHVPGARSLPWKHLLDTVPDLPPGPVVTMCTGGVRSALAWVILRDAGYSVSHYDAGWWEWSSEVAP